MLRLIFRDLSARRGMILLVAAGAALIAAAFTLFASASSATTLIADRTLGQYWRTTYDILVRAPRSVTAIEREYGLVRANHLSGTPGGITLAQWEQIKAIPGVEVAAPIAMLGYLPRDPVILGIRDSLPMGIYRYTASIEVQDGQHSLTSTLPTPSFQWYDNGEWMRLWAEGGEPYQALSQHLDDLGAGVAGDSESWRGFMIRTPQFDDMALLAAIDPEQEARLVHLDSMMVRGTYLKSGWPQAFYRSSNEPLIPVIVNVHDYIDERIHVQIEQVGGPVPGNGWYDWLMSIPNREALEALPGKVVWEQSLPMQRQWFGTSSALEVRDGKVIPKNGIYPEVVAPIYAPAPIDYRTPAQRPPGVGEDRLVLEAVPLGSTSEEGGDRTGGWNRPAEVVYRDLEPRTDLWLRFMPQYRGSFEIDPMAALGSASPNQVPLETYLLPQAILLYDQAGRSVNPPVALHPTLNEAGYLATPPDMLIPLDMLPFLFEQGCAKAQPLQIEGVNIYQFIEKPCEMGDDYISAVRVRVGGIDELDAAAQAKIERVAQAILEQTGLHVDIMVGSSPQPVLVHLPGYEDVPGQGYVEELWVKKNVNTLVQRGMNRADRVLFAGMLAACLLFLFNGSYLSVLGRLGEFGLLRAVGWRSGTLSGMLVGEVLLLGLLSGLLGAGLAFGLSQVLALSTSLEQVAWLVPLGGAAFVVGTLLPAWQAGRVAAAGVLGSQGIRHGRRLIGGGSLPGYALGGLLHRPARALASLLGLAVGAGGLVLLKLVLDGMGGELYGTLLGAWLRTQVQPYHFLMAGVALLVAALSVTQVMLLNVRQRRAEIGLLSALGWKRTDVFRLFLIEGGLVGLAGGLLGAGLALVLYRLAYQALPGGAVVWLQVAGLGLGLPLVVALVAVLYPAARAARLMPLEALRGEERLASAAPLRASLLWVGVILPVMVVTALGLGRVWQARPNPTPPPVAALSSPTPTPTPQPTLPWVTPIPVETADLPEYRWELVFEPQAQFLYGTGSIAFTNHTGKALDTIGLRLYPNAPGIGQEPLFRMRLGDEVRVGLEGNVDVTYEADNTLALLHLNSPLQPGESTFINLSYALDLTAYGRMQGEGWRLNAFFPMLAVYEDGGWRQDVCDFCTDVVYSQSANFSINLSLPRGWKVVATGLEKGVYKDDPDATHHTFEASSVRDLALAFAPDLQVRDRQFGETQVKVYFFPEDGQEVDAILVYAGRALEFYARQFGPYPYPSLSIVALSGPGTGGQEFPQLIYLYYASGDAGLERVIAHEVAHQWWYGVVGNDVFREAWLDEALAEYSSILYLQQAGETETAQELLQTYQNATLSIDALGEGVSKVGSPVSAFPDFSTYNDVVYKKGALFLHTLRQEIGDRAFFAGLRQYYAWYKFGVGRGRGFLEAMQQASGEDLRPLFDQWVGVENLR
jgi:hypothetical protein